MGLFSKLDSYTIGRLYQRLCVKDMLSLTLTCREMSQIGQVILHQEYWRVADQPPDEVRVSDGARSGKTSIKNHIASMIYQPSFFPMGHKDGINMDAVTENPEGIDPPS